MIIQEEIKLDYSDVLLTPKRSTLSSRSEVDVERSFKFIKNDQNIGSFTGVPIIAANMDGVGTMYMADILASMHIMTCLIKTYSAEELINYFNNVSFKTRKDFVAMSIGITSNDLKKLDDVMQHVNGNLKFLCVDVANGYSTQFAHTIRTINKRYPELILIAGNVVTASMTEELILAGASIVKVGIGSGAVCTTRIVAGVGMPQLSAVIECADAAHGLGGYIIADGGCTNSGDVAKSFAAGCFTPDTLVNTKHGSKKIKDIVPGDEVLTHNFRYRPVNEKYIYHKDEKMLRINGNIEVTKNHHFYVIDKKYKDIVTVENISEYATWIPADELSSKYLLIEQ